MNRLIPAFVGSLLLAATGCAIQSAPEGDPGVTETPVNSVVAPEDAIPFRAPTLANGAPTMKTMNMAQDPDPSPWAPDYSAPDPKDPDPSPWCNLCYASDATLNPYDPDPSPWCKLCFADPRDPDPSPWKGGATIGAGVR
jgi:hypothetical protein